MKSLNHQLKAGLDVLPVWVVVTAGSQVVYANPAVLTSLGYESLVQWTNEKSDCWTSLFIPTEPLAQPGVWQMGKIQGAKPHQSPALDVLCQATVLDSAQTLYVVLPKIESLSPAATGQPTDEKISQAHRDFISVVSHEFRTPLTSIKGFADTLLRYDEQLSAEQKTKFMTMIQDQADRLTRMVENLLTVSKLGESHVDVVFRAVPLAPMAKKVVENVLAKASQDPIYGNRTIDVVISPQLPDVWADRDKLEQVLTNLIDNAVKYSPKGSSVVLSAECNPANPDQLQIQVMNQSLAMTPEQQSKLFTRFSRVDNPLTRQVEGSGLGLYITKNLIEAMEGTIEMVNEPMPEDTNAILVRFNLALYAATPTRQAQYQQSVSSLPGKGFDSVSDGEEM